MMSERGTYTQRHWWWDSEDNEYTLDATWHYTPDDDDYRYIGEAVLLELEWLTGGLNDWLLSKDGDIWNTLKSEFNLNKAERIDNA